MPVRLNSHGFRLLRLWPYRHGVRGGAAGWLVDTGAELLLLSQPVGKREWVFSAYALPWHYHQEGQLDPQQPLPEDHPLAGGLAGQGFATRAQALQVLRLLVELQQR